MTMQVAVLFPGQGSQYAGMADPWLEHDASRALLERASEVLGWNVAEQSRDDDALKRTDVVQPAVFACDLAAFEVLKSEGVSFAAAAGHSLGEYAALVAAGALRFDDALRTLDVRAKAMQQASQQNPGAMTALIGMSPRDVRELVDVAGRGDVLQVANENGPRQVVVSGSLAAIERAEELCRSRGWRSIRLKVAGAFHSPLMEPAVQPVREAISRVHLSTPAFPVVPNASGKPTTQPHALRDLLGRHIASPVLWDASMRAMAAMGVTWFLEAGPGDVLGKLARRAAEGSTVASVGTPDEARQAARALREAASADASPEGA
jgi:[acyl-carrier-protein] S-malonyltransferase